MIADAVKAHRFVKALWAACEKEIIMTISEKVAYLKGLAEGLDLDTAKSKEGKLISVMIGILEEIGMSIEDLEENTVALGEEIDAISDDLSDVEKAVFDEDDDDDDCCCGHDHDHEHHHHHHADEVFTSWGMETIVPVTKDQLEDILKRLAETKEFGDVLRAKGMLPTENPGEWLYFDLVPEQYEIRDGKPDYTGKVCVIGASLKEEELNKVFGRG